MHRRATTSCRGLIVGQARFRPHPAVQQIGHGAAQQQFAFAQDGDGIAERLDLSEVVRAEQDGSACLRSDVMTCRISD